MNFMVPLKIIQSLCNRPSNPNNKKWQLLSLDVPRILLVSLVASLTGEGGYAVNELWCLECSKCEASCALRHIHQGSNQAERGYRRQFVRQGKNGTFKKVLETGTKLLSFTIQNIFSHVKMQIWRLLCVSEFKNINKY